jgi:predicted  nucleic acid-binding Zn-ribbon protein
MSNTKNTLRELRSKTDTALEEFVKAQIAVKSKIEEIEDLESTIHIKDSTLRHLTRGRQYTFLKEHEVEINQIHTELTRLKTLLEHHTTDLDDLKSMYRNKNNSLENARTLENRLFEQYF